MLYCVFTFCFPEVCLWHVRRSCSCVLTCVVCLEAAGRTGSWGLNMCVFILFVCHWLCFGFIGKIERWFMKKKDVDLIQRLQILFVFLVSEALQLNWFILNNKDRRAWSSFYVFILLNYFGQSVFRNHCIVFGSQVCFNIFSLFVFLPSLSEIPHQIAQWKGKTDKPVLSSVRQKSSIGALKCLRRKRGCRLHPTGSGLFWGNPLARLLPWTFPVVLPLPNTVHFLLSNDPPMYPHLDGNFHATCMSVAVF